MNTTFMLEIFPKLLQVFPFTLGIFLVSAVFGLVIGIILTSITIKKIPLLSKLTVAYISFMRSNPGLIHLLLTYYGLPYLLQFVGININFIGKAGFSIITLSFYHGAYISEIFRPAYLAVEKDQFDAADSIGMTRSQKIFRIIIPQVVPIALPIYANAVIDLFGDTSLLFTIGLIDIMSMGNIIINNTYGIYKVEVYVVIALIYWFFVFIISRIFKKFEEKSSKFVNN